MGVPRRCLRIAMLNADTSVPNTYADLGTFGDILHHVLAAAAARASAELSIQHAIFNVVAGEYPAAPSDFDAVVVTASAASSYDDEPWVRALERYLVTLYAGHPRVRIFGSCFGHHLVCQALLGGAGMRVGKHPRGWEIGVSDVELTEDFREAFGRSCTGGKDVRSLQQNSGRLPTPEAEETDGDYFGSAVTRIPPRIRLQFVHADEVVRSSPSSALPSPWVLLGSTEHCAVQGVYNPGRVLTLQGHFEFDKFENRETMRIFGAEDTPREELPDGRDFGAGVKEPEDDGELMAEMVVQFLANEQPVPVKSARQMRVEDEPLTPRASIDL